MKPAIITSQNKEVVSTQFVNAGKWPVGITETFRRDDKLPSVYGKMDSKSNLIDCQLFDLAPKERYVIL